jgi:hypothetical protein
VNSATHASRRHACTHQLFTIWYLVQHKERAKGTQDEWKRFLHALAMVARRHAMTPPTIQVVPSLLANDNKNDKNYKNNKNCKNSKNCKTNNIKNNNNNNNNNNTRTEAGA